MANCQYCDQKLTETDRFCPYCGAPVPSDVFSSDTSDPASANTNAQQASVDTSGDYSVTLVSLGTCAQAAAIDLLEDTVGYTESQARELVASVPTEAAVNLSRTQAQYIAQAMTEYGMQVSIQCAGEDVDLSSDAESSVFDSAGNFLGGVLRTLGVLTAANRLTSFRRSNKVSWLQKLFTPKYKRPSPPPHQRRLFGAESARTMQAPHTKYNFRENRRPDPPQDRRFDTQHRRTDMPRRNSRADRNEGSFDQSRPDRGHRQSRSDRRHDGSPGGGFPSDGRRR